MKKMWLTLIATLFAVHAQAVVQSEIVDYKDGTTDLQGYLAFDDAGITPRLAVLIVHQWGGQGEYENSRAKMLAALDHIKKDPRVDPTKIVVIGYCFGGTGALEMARAGADIVGAVSFHGALTNPNPQDVVKIKMPVMIHHGGIDPLVPETEVAAFKAEMDLAKVDWTFHSYANAVHSFTDPAAGNNPSLGFAYNEKADKRSWYSLLTFLTEVAPVPITKP